MHIRVTVYSDPFITQQPISEKEDKMKTGELYMIGHNVDHLENRYNEGMITHKEFETMKTPIVGLFTRYESDGLSEEMKALIETKLKELDGKFSKRNPCSVTAQWQHKLTQELKQQPDPEAYGVFMCDGEIQHKLKLSDVILTKV